eukprot:7782027-Heterocapsa_arctica.AAC.1
MSRTPLVRPRTSVKVTPAITGEMRKVQLTINRMKKHHILVNKGLAHSTEGAQPYYKLENGGTEAIE